MITLSTPVLPPDRFSAADIAFIVPQVLELVYTAWDMRPFAEDVWGELTTDDRRPTTEGAAGNAGGARKDDDERDDVGANRIRPRRMATPGDAGGEHDEHDDVGADRIRPRRAAMPGDAGDELDDRNDVDDMGGVSMAGECDSPLHNAGDVQSLASLQAEILRRNATCNIDAPADLFAPRDGFVLPPFRLQSAIGNLERCCATPRPTRC